METKERDRSLQVKSLEEIVSRRAEEVRAGCKTVTLIPGRMMQTFDRLSFRKLIVDIVRDFLYRPQDLYIDIRNFFVFAYQTAKKGFADDDIWDLTDTLREIIKPRLRAFKEMKRHTLPSELLPDDAEKADYEKAEKEWEEILDKMLYAFEHGSDDEEMPDYKRIQEGHELFGKYFGALWV